MANATMSSNLPAPKTFAPSREDVLSTLGFFFGDPAVPEKLKDYSEHHAMTYRTCHSSQYTRHQPLTHTNVNADMLLHPIVTLADFPDAFYGQNT